MKTFLIAACGFALIRADDHEGDENKAMAATTFVNEEADRMINYSSNINVDTDDQGVETLKVDGELGAKKFSIAGIGTKSSSAYNGFWVAAALDHDHMEAGWKYVECSALWASSIASTEAQCDCTGYKMNDDDKYG